MRQQSIRSFYWVFDSHGLKKALSYIKNPKILSSFFLFLFLFFSFTFQFVSIFTLTIGPFSMIVEKIATLRSALYPSPAAGQCVKFTATKKMQPLYRYLFEKRVVSASTRISLSHRWCLENEIDESADHTVILLGV